MGPKRRKPSEETSDRWRAEPMVAEGTIQTPDDVDGLDVSIRIDVSRITMRSGDTDLGSWPTGAVTITRIDDEQFVFVAEGDRLLFSPNDVDAFAAHPGVLDDTGTRQRRKKRTAQAPEAPSAEPQPPPASSTDVTPKKATDRAHHPEGVHPEAIRANRPTTTGRQQCRQRPTAAQARRVATGDRHCTSLQHLQPRSRPGRHTAPGSGPRTHVGPFSGPVIGSEPPPVHDLRQDPLALTGPPSASRPSSGSRLST